MALTPAASPAAPSTGAGSTAAGGPASGPPSGAYSPANLQAAYGLSSAAARTPRGPEVVAVVDAYNDPRAGADLSEYRSRFHLPSCTVSTGCLKIVNQRGQRGPLPAADPSGAWELEESLDLEMVSAACPRCHILLVEADSNSISALATAERIATLAANAVSNSWGSGAEFTGQTVFDPEFDRPGVAITAAAGDFGYGTQYPAASPFVTAVGGSTGAAAGLPGSAAQSVWPGTGSGCSVLEPRPSWQRAPGGCLNRTENDVAAYADPSPGVAVYDSVRYQGQAPGWTRLGGTSVGAPIIAAAYALADVAAGGPGRALIAGTYPAAYLYRHGGFTDVTSGANGSCEPGRRYLCRAAAGYDGPTGLGIPAGTAAFSGPAAGAVTVVNPGTRVLSADSPSRLPVRFTSTAGGGRARVTGTGLPAGLRHYAAGAFSGLAPRRAGSYRVTVTVAVAGAGTGSAAFTVVVLPRLADAHPGAGTVRLGSTGECLVPPGSRNRGRVLVAGCVGQRARGWEFVSGPSPWSGGTLRRGGQCLTAAAGSQPLITLRRCRAGAGQLWQYRSQGRLYNAHTGRCLAAAAARPRSGSAAVAAACGRAAQSWQLPPAPILAAVGGLCLTAPRASVGTQVEVARCTSGGTQRWVAGLSRALMIGGRCASVSGASRTDGAAVVVSRCNGSAAQQWLRGPNGELLNANSSRCLADTGNSAVPGAKVTQQDCYSQSGEAWLIS